MKTLSLFCFSLVVVNFAFQPRTAVQATAPEPNTVISDRAEEKSSSAGEAELRAASTKAIKVIQHSQVVWYQRETCTSCHHQLLPQISFNLARERGVPLDEKIARETTGNAFAFLKDLDSAVQGYDYIDIAFDGWALTAAHLAGVRRST